MRAMPGAGLLLVAALLHSAPAAAQPASTSWVDGWTARLTRHYRHFARTQTSSSMSAAAEPALLRCTQGDGPHPMDGLRLRFEPGRAGITLDSADRHLFQSATVTVRRLAAGQKPMDMLAAAARQGGCWTDKRYHAMVQAGRLLFMYSARCASARTPFYYDVADLVALARSTGEKVDARVLFSPCGAMETAPVPLAQIEKWAVQKRRLYSHRFPDDRHEAKGRAPVQPATPRVEVAPQPVPHLPPPSRGPTAPTQ